MADRAARSATNLAARIVILRVGVDQTVSGALVLLAIAVVVAPVADVRRALVETAREVRRVFGRWIVDRASASRKRSELKREKQKSEDAFDHAGAAEQH